MYYNVSAECCGTFGRRTLYGGELIDRPPKVFRMHYEFDQWPNDQFLECNLTFIGTVELSKKLQERVPRITGVTYEEVTVTNTVAFRQNNSGKELPEYRWFKVTGKAGVDDFGMSGENLVVSEVALTIMKPLMNNCKTSIYIRGDGQPPK